MKLLNISAVKPDTALQEVQDVICGEAHVPGAREADVDGVATPGVFELVRDAGGEVQLDLIAHSRAHDLHLSSWLITDVETETAAMVHDLETASITRIRLLGCETAKRQGRKAMRHVRDELRKKWPHATVFGSKTMLYAEHFNTDGFIAPQLLVEVSGLPASSAADDEAPSAAEVAEAFAQLEPLPSKDDGIDVLLARLKPETDAEARFDVSRYSGDSAWPFEIATPSHPPIGALIPSGSEIRVAPGLLLLPDWERVYPVSGTSGLFHRVTWLLGGFLLRVYPRWMPHGVIVRPPHRVPTG